MRSKLFAGAVAIVALATPGIAMAQSGGNGQFQESQQFGRTLQEAMSQAKALQNVVNGNSPSNAAKGNITGGSNAANQFPAQAAQSLGENGAKTEQNNPQIQLLSGSSGCTMGCGGNGQAQLSAQFAETLQEALSGAEATQHATNGNAPVNIAGGNITGGSNSANQGAANAAQSEAENDAATKQNNLQVQEDAGSACKSGCGGNGQFQESNQAAATGQQAASEANANQNAVNANVPVNIAGGNITGGSNSANQQAANAAASAANNNAATEQNNTQVQSAGPSSCTMGCGGNGQAQSSEQEAQTAQTSASQANANQTTVNANVPVNIAGGNITAGSNEANQASTNTAASSSNNNSSTTQNNEQVQTK
jgi:hypothetical protein